jgi:hypothetical protein
MKSDTDQARNAFGLLASGSSGCWSIDLDESHDGTEWSLQLDGPRVYLTFALRDLQVIQSAIAYLRAKKNQTGAISLGHFESASVSLHWDNEDIDRCFLIVGPNARSTLRLTLSADDTEMLADSLEQIREELPAT